MKGFPTKIKQIFQALRKRKKLSVVLLILLILAGFGIRKVYLANQPEAYQTFSVRREGLTKTLEVSGNVEAGEFANLHFQAGGKLAWIGVKEGEKVNRWQVLASLDKRTLEKQLKQDLIAFEKEYRDFQQTAEDTPPVNHRLKRILENAQFDLNNEVLDVEIKNLAMELANLVSPIEGIVTLVDTPVAGVNVLATDTVSVVNPDTVYFEVEIDEADIAYLKEGQTAKIRLDAYEDEEIDSQVLTIDFSASISGGGGTVFKTSLSLPGNDNLKFRLGMTGDADIVLEEKANVLVVPLDAVIERDGKKYVDILAAGNRPERREISLGLENEEYAEVLAGLSESDKVIIPR